MEYNKPRDYLKAEYHKNRHWLLGDRSEKIYEFFQKYVDKKDSILELGCSSGRNLIFLNLRGYKNLTGLEMSDEIDEPKGFKLIKGRWEETELQEYDVIFSASFLQEFQKFPQELFDKTLQKTRKYFMIFGDLMRDKEWKHEGFEIVEQVESDPPFSQPIIILKKI